MKKKISKIWGVGLILMMVVSLLLWTAPVAADTLEWDDESIPDDGDFVIWPGEIVSLGVAEDGVVIYVGLEAASTIYVSTDQGVTWDDSSSPSVDVDFIAVAPDDPKYVVVADDGATDVIISDDGGATWDELGNPLVVTTVMCLAVSREVDDSRWIAVGGTDGSGDAAVEYYEIGAIGADWEDMSILDGFTGTDEVGAIAFSPNFHSDEILTAVTSNANVAIHFEMFSFNQEAWNGDAGFDDFPVDIVEHDGVDVDVDGLEAASIALSPDYLGSDDDMRIAFVGITTAAGSANEDEGDGIFRLENDDVDALEDETNIKSIAFDGSNLLAGGYDNTDVYSSDDPLASSPDVNDTASFKAPGGEEQTLVGFAGDLVVAATYGDEGCFSISRDMGSAFNDISLIDTVLTDLVDVGVAPDGETVYLVTADASTDVSLWRMAEDQDADWERVLSLPSEDVETWMVRFAPDAPDVVYLAEFQETMIYYSTDAGESRWRSRASRYEIYDLAVEGTGETLYVLENVAACLVSKSTNTGFTWGGHETTGISDGPSVIASLGEDLVIVGSNGGTVTYSTDGNDSWTDLEDTMDGDDLVQVTATGLSDGDFIFASTAGAADSIYRWELGEDDSWDDIEDMAGGYYATGIGYADGALYVLTTDGTDSSLYRSIDPMGSSPGFDTADTTAANDVEFTVYMNSALHLSSGSVNLWALDQGTTTGPALYNYEDTIGLAAPTLKAPANGFDVPMNEISGWPANTNLVWESPSDEIYQFEVEIAFDEDFDEGFDSTLVPDPADEFDEGDTINAILLGDELIPGQTYYWHVRVIDPVESNWSVTRSFTVEDAKAPSPITVEIPPTPDITVELPAPEVTVTIPPVVQVPPAPAPAAGWALVTMIVLGALLVVALIVLILRTRRVV